MDASLWTGRAPSAVTSAAACGLSTMRIFCPANCGGRTAAGPTGSAAARLRSARRRPRRTGSWPSTVAATGRGHPLAGRDRGHREGSHQRLESGHANGGPVTGRLVGEAHPPGTDVRRQPRLVGRQCRVVGLRVDGDLQRPMRSFAMSCARYRPSGSDPSGICSTMACGCWSVEPALLIGLVLHAVRPPRAATAATARSGGSLRYSCPCHRLPAPHLPAIRAGTEPVIRAGRKLPLRTVHRDTNGCRSPQTLALSCHEGKGEGRVTGVPAAPAL